MRTPSAPILEMARSLFAASRSAPNPDAKRALVVNEHLRLSLTRFCGADGFAALQRRALALASTQMPMLKSSKVGADGRIPPELAPSDVRPAKHPRGRPVPSKSKGKSHA